MAVAPWGGRGSQYRRHEVSGAGQLVENSAVPRAAENLNAGHIVGGTGAQGRRSPFGATENRNGTQAEDLGNALFTLAVALQGDREAQRDANQVWAPSGACWSPSGGPCIATYRKSSVMSSSTGLAVTLGYGRGSQPDARVPS